MNYPKYSLAKKGKVICPSCLHKTLVLYLDNSTGIPLDPEVGKCDRLDKCKYHKTPKMFYAENPDSLVNSKLPGIVSKPILPKLPSLISEDLFIKTLIGYSDNRFIQYLSMIVGEEAAKDAIHHYKLGSSKHWDGATIFWQIDRHNRVRTGKIMQYDSQTGKRIKKPQARISWVHSVLKLPNYNLSQCFFGEHLLIDTTKTVAIVESEKTAVIASVYFPEFIWLSCGGSEGLNLEKCSVLQGRRVILFPDCGKYDKWCLKAKELAFICSTTVSSLIEKSATERERQDGFDLADYLVRFSPGCIDQQRNSGILQGKPQLKSEQKQDKKFQAFVSSEGKLYIPTPPDNRTTFTVYPNIEAYNNRSILPHIKPIDSEDYTQMMQVFIDSNKLMINVSSSRNTTSSQII